MYNLFKILYTYIKITLKITYYHLFEIDIKNDNDRLENLKDDISNCGFMMIKSVQWLLPSYNLIYPNTKLYDILNIFYEDCNIHDIKYTEHIYYNNYKKYIYEDYDVLDVLGSGSIGQVYKIQNIYTNKYYALKVLHPNVEYEYTVFSIFVYILSKFVNFKKYLPIYDLDIFLKSIRDQIDLNKESNNCKNIYNLYENCENINIPKIYSHDEKIIIMEYLEGDEYHTKSLGEYDSYKNLIKLVLFANNCCLNGMCHGDLHNGNWKINNDKNLIVYDFGYVFKIDDLEYDLINKLISKDDKTDINKNFFDYYLNKSYNAHIDKEIIMSRIHHITDEYILIQPPKLHSYIQILMNFCLKNDIMISSTCLNGMLLFLQLIETFNSVKLLESEATFESYITDILNNCKVYNSFPKLIKYCEKKLEENGNQGIMSENFDRFKNLKKFM